MGLLLVKRRFSVFNKLKQNPNKLQLDPLMRNPTSRVKSFGPVCFWPISSSYKILPTQPTTMGWAGGFSQSGYLTYLLAQNPFEIHKQHVVFVRTTLEDFGFIPRHVEAGETKKVREFSLSSSRVCRVSFDVTFYVVMSFSVFRMRLIRKALYILLYILISVAIYTRCVLGGASFLRAVFTYLTVLMA